ncbi:MULTISPECIES: CsgG/HfaB family protein [Pseudomonas]|uniref:CsgG/HfaB family protein n=1 Tax=Pseudomonas TaxID=286 RepID=UPI000A977680|nr:MULTISPECIES: CsgG/HfaB family protein [Pseudomonas]MDT3230496.1 CsgG/HfaB family protein [Pseudomonas sp. rhizo25]
MSIHSINNIARIVDFNKFGDLAEASNKSSPALWSGSEGIKRDVNVPASTVSESKTETDKLPEVLTALRSISFQLQALISDRRDRRAQVRPDAPAPSVEVTPQVTPEPVAPKPGAALEIQGLSSKRNGAKPDNIWSGFRQGPDGNCVTVSAIKAAMYRFGQSPTDIFKEVIKTSGGYQVVMRDDFKLTLTDRELAEGARSARFVGADKGMLKDAQFLFAVSAKRAQMENNDRTAGRSFQAAIRSLNNGEDETGPGEGFMRLGLKKHMKKVSVRDLANGQLGMCNRAMHSVAVINGREELWGRQGSAPTRGQAVALM